MPTVGLIDLVVAATTRHANPRYAMLCEADAHARAAWVIHHLGSLHRVSSPTRRKHRPDNR